MIVIDLIISVWIIVIWHRMGSSTDIVVTNFLYGTYTVIWTLICVYFLLAVDKFRRKLRGA